MMEREEFAELVRRAVHGLPKAFRQRMRNVSIEVEDYPSREVQEKMHVGRRSLYGLYQGVPLVKRSVWHNFTGPDRITIYQANIEASARTPEEITALVREVVMHEVGHYFGLSEEELKEARGE